MSGVTDRSILWDLDPLYQNLWGVSFDISIHGSIDGMHLLTNLCKHSFSLLLASFKTDAARGRFKGLLDTRMSRVCQKSGRSEAFPSRPGLFLSARNCSSTFYVMFYFVFYVVFVYLSILLFHFFVV